MNTELSNLREKAAALPLCPGVYIMKNARGEIIYVGKSKLLKNRVSSYFIGKNHSYKTQKMVSQVADFDYIVCDTEIEALSLENVLIKKHTPKYNIKLKDAKSYPYIKIGTGSYPKISVTRDRRGEGMFFGPYSGISDAYSAVDAIKKTFKLPRCKREFPRDIGRERPCLYSQMGVCCAVCTGKVSKEHYASLIQSAKTVLSGGTSSAIAELDAQMKSYAENELFEEAARCRDSILALRKLSDKQRVVGSEQSELDAIALYNDELCGVISVFSVREGKLTAKNDFLFSSDECVDSAAICAFLCGYYDDCATPPAKIALDFSLEDEDLSSLEELLSAQRKKRVYVTTPKRGEAKSLCEMAAKNAKERAQRYRIDAEKEDRALLLLAKTLCLEVLPERIEAYDISNIGDEHICASMVVYADKKMKSSDYRIFKIKTTEGADDYASMREVLTRRLSHIGESDSSLGKRPDLILLDGGHAHVNVGKAVLRERSLDIPIFGMVKDEHHKTRTLCDGENELGIAHEQALYALIFRMQEEAHRFAVKHSSGAKRRTLRRSSLCDIDGIGDKKAKLLLSAFGSIKRLSEASEQDIASVRGITQRDAKNIKKHFEKAN
jgi:excinuclease ABC subunit C